MKKRKTIISLLLTMVMVLTMSVSVFADTLANNETTGSITINDAVKGQTYTVYQILDLESYNKASNAYSYKATDAWKNFIDGDGIKGKYVTVNTQGYVEWIENADAAAFAKLARTYAKDNSIGNQGIKKADSTTVSFTGLDLGYYLVDTTLGTICSLDTTNPDVTMEEKNEEPVPDKTVEEDSTGAYGKVNDGDIGQTVNFQAKIEIPMGSENIVMHDKMSAGLTLNQGSIKVYTDKGMKNEFSANNYTVKTANLDTCEKFGKECDFEVAIKQDYVNGLTEKMVLYVGYSATINKNAVVGDEGNPNEVVIRYGDETNATYTPASTTKTYTWNFDVLKYGDGKESNVLKDAKFVLLNNDKSKVATIENGKLTGWVAVPVAGDNGKLAWPENTELTTDEKGEIAIAGLDADTYYLRETQAPDGYNKLKEDEKVDIIPTESKDKTTLTLAPVTAKINNNSGTELPSTGGMGTKILYIAGGALVLLAVVALFMRKRTEEEE